MNKPNSTDRPQTRSQTIERPRAEAGRGASGSRKRGYVAPQLSTYGPIAKLTQSGGRSGTDGSTMRACL